MVSWEPAVAPEALALPGRQKAILLSEIAGHTVQVTVRRLAEIPLRPSGKHVQGVKLPFD